jgi:hypothetical protein
MFKTSVATRVISFTVLITLLLASFPTAVAAANENNRGLEAKWAKLVVLYKRQSQVHHNAPRWVEWITDNSKVSKSKKAELKKDLAISNAVWASVPSIVIRHNGFDADGNVVDKAAARESVRDLSKALQRYNASIKSLRALLRQLNMKA